MAEYGLPVPRSRVARAQDAVPAAQRLVPPFAVKGVGLAHKSEHGAVRLNVGFDMLDEAARQVGTEQVLIEEMATGALAELLIGVTRDPAHGYVLTLGAGGVLTELLHDTVSVLVPASRAALRTALGQLACAPLLAGYRGKPAVDMDAVLDAVLSVQAYVIANAATVGEVEINPLICRADGVVAVDALIRKASE